MISTIYIPVALLAGIALAIIFYGGLWLTVRRLPTARHPVWLTLSSFWTRTFIVVASVLVVIRGSWRYALICLAGFIIGRLAVSRYVAPRRLGAKCP